MKKISIRTLFQEEYVFYWLAFILAIGLNFGIGTKIYPDSESYITYAIERPPLYPAIIYLFKFAFATRALEFLVFFQLLGGLFTCAWSVYKLDTLFSKIHASKFLVFILLTFPYFYTPYYGNTILSEAVSYPFFLIVFINVLEVIINTQKRHLYALPALISLLILTRFQFFFLVPWFILFCLYLVFSRTHIIKLRTIALLIIFCAAMPSIIDKSVRYSVHGDISAPPYLFQQLLVTPLVVSNVETADSIADLKIRKIFIDIKTRINNIKIDVSDPGLVSYARYHLAYDKVYYGILTKVLEDAGYTRATEKELIAKELYFLLMQDSPTFYASLNMHKKNIFRVWRDKYLVVLGLAIMVGSLFKYQKQKDSYSVILFFITFICLSNTTLVGVLASFDERYTFYTDIIFMVTLLILLQKKTDIKKVSS